MIQAGDKANDSPICPFTRTGDFQELLITITAVVLHDAKYPSGNINIH
jgi:hypothetical protein